MLGGAGLTPDKEIIVYCHTHHRSAHSYTMLKHLGYERVRAYDGSWSEWGNDPSLPIE
jgi:thiosulfate/3-mercaptopyruvate sulfurtransferase